MAVKETADDGPTGSRDGDVEKFVPDDASPLMGDDHSRPGDKSFGNTYFAEDAIYVTGVHCTSCGCFVAKREDGGRVVCPACGWTSEDE